ncbi:coiled-coil domain-containing protein 124 isoform X1 [Carettochelys insculpta]|uniref:coiled-coil domain-containing protein 124 isoform X1 n=1 Tax=Carettochelys insculpta TaxID=44489 RepID=UPI003EBC4D5B
MPKKFQGENTKSAAARARKAEAKAAADAKRQQELEDAFWKDEDKHVMRKEQRKASPKCQASGGLCCQLLHPAGMEELRGRLLLKRAGVLSEPANERCRLTLLYTGALMLQCCYKQEEREKRRLEQLERKKELQRLLEEEDSKLKGKSPKQSTPGKITRAQIEETIRKDQLQKESGDEVEKQKSHLDVPLEENLNRRVLEEGTVEARTIEDAIAVLSVAEDLDRHPERRMKAAFATFEEVHLPRLKQENPNMRLSQLKQLLKKEWMRSLDNPMNQRHLTYNSQK